MVLTTTHSIEGFKIIDYIGIVTGIKYLANYGKGATFKEMFSSKKYDVYARGLEEAKENAFQDLQNNAKKLNANAVVGISIDVEVSGTSGITIVSVTGTAVKVVE